MKWTYRCPICGELRSVEWADRDKRYLCHNDQNKSYTPPLPSQQPSAYVDAHDWPEEMEDAVIKVKDKMCTVPGCSRIFETLDHRQAYSKGGKTSVDNLFPICVEHNQSKGDKDYQAWLNTLIY